MKMFSKKTIIFLFALFLLCFSQSSQAAYLLIRMDDQQTNHLKAYGIAFSTLERGGTLEWLLNYQGGSFLIPLNAEIQHECTIKNVKAEVISDSKRNLIISKISQPDENMEVVKLEKAPKMAVYAPPGKQPWDDAVMMALEYAEIPYEKLYDGDIIEGKLEGYDWLHLHHEDFTGQYGKFYRAYNNMAWYQKQVSDNEQMAEKYGFAKVSQMKLHVAKTIKLYVSLGGFLFSMCSGADSFDIALAAEGLDICESMYDGDPADPDYQSKLDYSKTLAFHNFTIVEDPFEYEYSSIDATQERRIPENQDYFTLFDFSAKWDPVPTMLCQNHTRIVKGFMGQTTSFFKEYIKPNILILGENAQHKEARYIHGELGKGTWTFYGGHDPEDYRHLVGDEPTDMNLFPNSPGYRLILNNVLFPAAKKKKLKT